MTVSSNSFDTRAALDVDGTSYEIFRLGGFSERLPYSLKILLENLLRHEDGVSVTADDISALGAEADREIAFAPARILMQDFTGVPGIVDLAAMRDAVDALGGDLSRVNP